MSIVFAAPRSPAAVYNTILKSGTDGEWHGKNRFLFHCLSQKWGEKEEFKFPVQIGPDYNIIQSVPFLCQSAQKMENIQN